MRGTGRPGFGFGSVKWDNAGRDTLLAAYCYVIGGDHDWRDASVPVLEQGRHAAGVRIGAGAWIGAGAKILDGVVIGDGAIVGAGAVVREEIPERAVAVGVPARVVGRRDGNPGAAAGEPGLALNRT